MRNLGYLDDLQKFRTKDGMKLGQWTTSLYAEVLRKLLLLREKEEDPLHLESFKHQLRAMMSGVRLQFQEKWEVGNSVSYTKVVERDLYLKLKLKILKPTLPTTEMIIFQRYLIIFSALNDVKSFAYAVARKTNLQAVASSYASIIFT